MIGVEGLSSADPLGLLESWQRTASDRKLRLFACACVRRVWHLVHSPAGRVAVETAERYADGQATREELMAARASAWAEVRARQADYWRRCAAHACLAVVAERARKLPAEVVGHVWCAKAYHPSTGSQDQEEWRFQWALLRDVAGNPGPPLTLPPGALAVRAVAQAAYEERLPDGTLDPVRLAVLADALDDAGCTASALLEHLRGPGPHVRGCWALDTVLARP